MTASSRARRSLVRRALSAAIASCVLLAFPSWPAAAPAGAMAVAMAVAMARGPAEDEGAWVAPTAPSPLVVLRRFVVGPYRWSPGHRGVDLAAPAAGAPIASPTDGVVSFSGDVAGTPVVVVTHRGGLRSTLQPATSVTAVGQVVAEGAPVARLAAAPGPHCPSGPCLHWGVLRGSAYLDPLSFLAPPPPTILLPLLESLGSAAPGVRRDLPSGAFVRAARARRRQRRGR